MHEGILWLLIAVAAAVLIGVLLSQSRKRKRADVAATRRRADQATTGDPLKQDFTGGNPLRLRIGDAVNLPGIQAPFAVRGQITYRDGEGYTWKDFLIDNGCSDRRYLCVEADDGDVEVTVWTTPGVELKPTKEIAYNGVAYHRVEQGSAQYKAEGTTDLSRGNGAVRYHDYQAADGRLLSIERYNDAGPWEVSAGFVIPQGTLQVTSRGAY